MRIPLALFLLSLAGCGGSGDSSCSDQICELENTTGASANHWVLTPGGIGEEVTEFEFYSDGTGALMNSGSTTSGASEPGEPGYIAPTKLTFNWTRSSGSTNFILFSNLSSQAFIYGSGGSSYDYGTLVSMTFQSGSIASGGLSATVTCSPSDSCAHDYVSATLAGGSF